VFPIDLATATVEQLSRLLDDKKITSMSLTQAYLARMDGMNSRGPALNAVRALNPNALAEAEAADHARSGPLRGIPVLIKDNIDVRGMPTTVGSVALAHSYPRADATLVTNLRRAGAVILGKTNLTEFANFLTEGMPGGYSSLGGQVRNPYDTSQSPSGSSAGSACAVAAGLAALTVGTETNGSILSPSAANSIVGVKPTVGLISRTGVVPIASSQDTAGPMTRTVADAAAELTALTGIDPTDPATANNPLADHDFTRALRTDALRGARIGVVRTLASGALWNAAVAELTTQGATIVEVDLDTDTANDSTVLNYEFKRDLNAYLATLPPCTPIHSLAEVIAYNDSHPQVALKFGQTRALASEAMDLSPDSADTARHATDRAQDLTDTRGRLDPVMTDNDLTALLFAGTAGASIGAIAGYPSITVPAGYQAANRRPFNITFLGQPWSEPTLIGYAYAYEQASQLRRPPSQINPSLFR
jgi:amidase